VRPTIREPSLDPVEPIQATCCPGWVLAVAWTEPSQPPSPAIAVHPHR
jgi:hypothetical protein